MKKMRLTNGIITIIVGIFFSCICMKLLMKSKSIIPLPFFLVGFFIILFGIMEIWQYLNEEKTQEEGLKIANLETILKWKRVAAKSYIYFFLTLWFGFLIFIDFIAIKHRHNGGMEMVYFSLLFWLAGIIILISTIKKK